jgi:hypothetical protein
VFVWIHGGGFILGANSWPHYDHAKLVKLASERGVPVIGVGIKSVLTYSVTPLRIVFPEHKTRVLVPVLILILVLGAFRGTYPTSPGITSDGRGPALHGQLSRVRANERPFCVVSVSASLGF